MRQLLPEPADDVDPLAVIAAEARPRTGSRPWLLVNMVASADGATAIEGRSGDLGSAGDKAVFAALRSVADVVLVAAGTARAEDYGPTRARPDGTPGPRIAVVTRSGDLDPSARVFSSGSPIVLTCEACPADRRAALAEVAEVVVAGSATVDLARAVAGLPAEVVLSEGGPSLNGQLLAADLVDEWCLTVSPLLVGGTSSRPAVGPPAAPAGLRLDRVLAQASFLFLRYLRR